MKTQKTVARECKVSERHYQRLEAGEFLPTMECLFMISKSLEVSPGTFADIAFNEWSEDQQN